MGMLEWENKTGFGFCTLQGGANKNHLMEE